MSIRLTVGLITLSAIGLWLAVVRPAGPVTAAAHSTTIEPAVRPGGLPAATTATTAEPPPPRAPRNAAAGTRAAMRLDEPIFAPESAMPDAFPEALRVALEEEQRRVNATRELAASKLRHHMASEPIDSARTDRILEEYEEVLDDFQGPVRSQARCTAKVCQVTVETGDPEVLASLQKLHGDRGYKPMTSIDGDRNVGSIRSVTYSLVDERLLEEMMGPDTTGIFAPGRTEELVVERP